MKVKKVIYQVECANNPKHIIEKFFEIKDGSEHLQTEVQVYCPQCDDWVTATVQGKFVPNQEIVKRFKKND